MAGRGAGPSQVLGLDGEIETEQVDGGLASLDVRLPHVKNDRVKAVGLGHCPEDGGHLVYAQSKAGRHEPCLPSAGKRTPVLCGWRKPSPSGTSCSLLALKSWAPVHLWVLSLATQLPSLDSRQGWDAECCVSTWKALGQLYSAWAGP